MNIISFAKAAKMTTGATTCRQHKPEQTKMTITDEGRAQRIAAMTEEVRRRLLAQCKRDADAELIDAAASELVSLQILDAHMTHAGQRLSSELEAQYAAATYVASQALDMLGIRNPFQPPAH
jgi:hypothetical protein